MAVAINNAGQQDYLLSALAQEEASLTLSAEEISTVEVPFYRPPSSQIDAPVPYPAVYRAVSAWLESRETSIADVPSGKALVKCFSDMEDPGGFRKRLRFFHGFCQGIGIAERDLPTTNDMRLCRNLPRVFVAIARVAEVIDEEGWAACLEECGIESIGNWRDVMVDEEWLGDDITRQLVRLFGDCSVIVAGSQGSGKSSTIATLLGRMCIPQSHALTYDAPDEELTEAELSGRDKLRHLRYINWPFLPIESNMPLQSQQIDRIHVKVESHVLSMIELPSMETEVYGYDEYGGISTVHAGDYEEVLKNLQTETPCLIILVERLDDVDERRFKHSLHKLQRIFGRAMLSRLLVILTHGQSLPGSGLAYEVWAFDQKRKITGVLAKFANGLQAIPVVVVENSEHCKVNEHGRRVLPDGTNFLELVQKEVDNIGSEVRDGGLKPLPTTRWWERYTLFLGAVLLLSQFR